MYNALTRDVEAELFPAIKTLGIRFYAYNPLAGGLLTGKYGDEKKVPDTGRFAVKKKYLGRFWKASYFDALQKIREACEKTGIPMTAAALRWIYHHSLLDGTGHDGCIIGATRLIHLENNLKACNNGKLPESLVDALNAAWDSARPDCPRYFKPRVRKVI